MAKKAGNSIYLKEYNRCMLLSLVQRHGCISYSDLSKASGLTFKSTYEIIKGLIEEEYIMEAFIGESKGGRKPVMLSLKPNSYYSIGLDIDVGTIKGVLMDHVGNILHEFECKTLNTNYESNVKLIEEMIVAITRKFEIPQNRLLGVGISVPGFINSKTKEIIMAPNLGWEHKNITDDLKNKLGFNIYIENDAMASAACEKWMGDCKNDKDFICIVIMSGIGAGIYASDKPLNGASGSAGEIGHMPIDKDGPICACRNRGCLETFSSTTSILKKAKNVYNKEISLDELLSLAKDGDPKALHIFNTASEYLGLAIAYLVNIFNPSKVVLGKDFVKYSDYMLDGIIKKVKGTALKSNYESLTITVSKFGGKAPVLGAAMLPVKALFNI